MLRTEFMSEWLLQLFCLILSSNTTRETNKCDDVTKICSTCNSVRGSLYSDMILGGNSKQTNDVSKCRQCINVCEKVIV